MATTISSEMLPFAMQDLTRMVMQKKKLSFEDALYYIYSSRLYQTLLDEEAKAWYESTLSLYESLEKEKIAERHADNNNPRITLFQMFCIENYRTERQMDAKEALSLFTRHKVFDFLSDTFEMLHTQDKAYILDSIDTYIKHPNKQA